MEPQEPTAVIMVGSCIQPTQPELAPPQITSTTFEAEGAHSIPQQLKELKAQGNGRCGLAQPSGPHPASFSGFVHSIQASLPIVPPLSCATHLCPL